jgi:hypothetical protein
MFFRVKGGFLLYHKNMLKAKLQDIVQPKKRGSRGVPMDLPVLRTQSAIFLGTRTLNGLFLCFQYEKNQLQLLEPGKDEVLF